MSRSYCLIHQFKEDRNPEFVQIQEHRLFKGGNYSDKVQFQENWDHRFSGNEHA